MGVVGAPIGGHHHMALPPNVRIHIPKYEEGSESDNHIILCTIPEYGRVLFIDDQVQFVESDEYLYHESLVHPAMTTQGNPKDVLIIGGGDGLALREVLKWPVKRVDLVDIDQDVVNLGKHELKDLNSNAFSDTRVRVFINDGREFLEKVDKRYDVIIIDSTDPEADERASRLFSKEFYLIARQKLKPDGVLVTQASACESLTFSRIYKTLSSVFPFVRPYCVNIQSIGRVGFILASNFHDPLSVTYVPPLQTKVYNLIFHKQLFEKQPIIRYDASIITDSNPIKQTYFFSAKLDNDERIIKIIRVNIEEGRVRRKGYLAITNKRFLLADVDGVYSFTSLSVTKEALYELGIAFILYLFLIFLALLVNKMVVWIVSLLGIILSISLGLPLTWNKLRVSGVAEFYKSNFRWTIEGGERTESRAFSAIIWSNEISSKELTLLKPR